MREVQRVEEPLKDLIKDLGDAIDRSLSESESIAQAIGEIRKEGYDVLLVLEATIGFNRRAEKTDVPEDQPVNHQDLDETLTEQDYEFLKTLSISLDE